MKAVMVMFDSLNRRMLPPYGCDWVKAPNFERLARRTVTFDRSYVCSMPCMPARRDLHTGRPNFLHRGWGPIEPFDDSMPQMLKSKGIHTHLATDHQHYWEDGGATYHQRYSTFEFLRGQEGDKWHGVVNGVEPIHAIGRNTGGKCSDNIEWQDRVNRTFVKGEADMPQARTFASGLRFIEQNHDQDNWLLHLETFDPHEPFHSLRAWKDLYPEHYANYDGPLHDWPPYRRVQETLDEVEHIRFEYAALVSMCDNYLGQVLDAMDRHDLWKDTMLIVWTDHGFLLGEHDSWAKCWCPFYNEIANTPFFVWDPRSGRQGERREALVQPSIDLPVTLLNYFGVEPAPDMLGRDLAAAVDHDARLRDAAIFGQFGGMVNVTDGRHVLMAGTERDNVQLCEYTHMPTRMKGPFTPKEMRNLVGLAEPFAFTKDCRTMKIAGDVWKQQYPTTLYDLKTDPGQTAAIDDPDAMRRMRQHLTDLMAQCDAPRAQYERLGLTAPATAHD
jgi:arylsulfatase A-like enzyme